MFDTSLYEVRDGKLCLPRKHRTRKVIADRDTLAAQRQEMSVNVLARLYGVSRSTMYRELRRYGLTEAEEGGTLNAR